MGTGDDIARALELPRDDAKAAADVIADGRTRTIDYAVISSADGAERAFLAVMSAGFDSEVTERANNMKWPTGKSRYLLATIAELGVLQARRLHHHSRRPDDSRRGHDAGHRQRPELRRGHVRVPERHARQRATATSTFLTRTSKATFLKIFPRVFKGTHIHHRTVRTMRGTQIHVAAPGQTAYADGERVGPLPVDVHVVASGLRVFAPVG